jgi:hypothetical protein
MPVQATCPGCGAELVFATGAALRVCDHCNAVVARRDRDLENLGRVVDLVVSGSPLELDLDGTYLGKTFTLVGHTQIAHPKGGVWDEWYAAFADGRWGWLAEHQGKFVMTFAELVADLPTPEALTPGQTLTSLPGGPWQVVEKSAGTRRGAKGELPFRLKPGETFVFADLATTDGKFATIDWGASGRGEASFYVGREVTLAELGLAGRAPAERPQAVVGAERLACPSCDGNLELRAPDRTQRIGCPFCSAVLEVDQGKLTKLELVNPGGDVQLELPLGASGTLSGGTWTVIGLIVRESDGFEWQEYLLYDPKLGFRWLVNANHHWSFVEPIPTLGDGGSMGPLVLAGRRYRPFLLGEAKVVHVRGECYWKVVPGEKVATADWVSPPFMLSLERDESEVNWSRGHYLPAAEIERAFGVTLGATPIGVAPHQPYPYWTVLRSWSIVLGAAFVLALAFYGLRTSTPLLRQEIEFPEPTPGASTSVRFVGPMTVAGRKNLEITVTAPDLDNEWFYLEGDFVNEASGVVQEWSTTVEHYHGITGGESWREGGRSRTVRLSAMPAGVYDLRLEAQPGRWATTAQPVPFRATIQVVQNVPRWGHFLWLALGLSIVPILVIGHGIWFEKRRWEDSSFGGGGTDE